MKIMFEFNTDIFSHMPFVGAGAGPTFATAEFCCLKVGGKWKLHQRVGNEWKRIATGLPEDATECSPCAEYVPESGKWSVSFVAGGAESSRRFYLYEIEDIENPETKKVVAAAVGFVFKNRIVYAQQNGALYIVDGTKVRTFTFKGLQFFYRVSYNPQNPSEILISGKDNGNAIFSWIFNPNARTLSVLTVDGLPAYKAAFWRGQLYYAQRGIGMEFEERKIVRAEKYNVEPLDFDSLVESGEMGGTPSTTQMVKNFVHATARWARAGFQFTDEETLALRTEICIECPFWDATARFGLGKCKKCGCTSAKLKLATEKCPVGKW